MKKNLLFRYRVEKSANPVRKGFAIFMLTLLLTNSIFISAKGGELFAAEAKQLKDEELDIVYAEGISFNYEGIVGKANDLINNAFNKPNKLTSQGTINFANTKGGSVANPSGTSQTVNPALLALANNGELPSATQMAENGGAIIEDNPLQLDVTLGSPVGGSLGGPGVVSSGTTSNVVMVSDSSQQNLSSLVNVNAAGSIVPVLINIVININSQVDKLENSNNLDLSNYYRY
jgi:hypothetical protein